MPPSTAVCSVVQCVSCKNSPTPPPNDLSQALILTRYLFNEFLKLAFASNSICAMLAINRPFAHRLAVLTLPDMVLQVALSRFSGLCGNGNVWRNHWRL